MRRPMGGCAFIPRCRPQPGVVGRSGWPTASFPCRRAPRWSTSPAGFRRHGRPPVTSVRSTKPARWRSPQYCRPAICGPGCPLTRTMASRRCCRCTGTPRWPLSTASRTARWSAWNPQAVDRQHIDRGIRAARRPLPDSRLLRHLETCATDYRCLTAQNVFLRRGEGAIPVSPACNAACLGCISEQWGDVASPQTRLGFAPTAAEIAELAAWHLSAGPANFVSFGQGCEGEALTRGAVVVGGTRRIRSAWPSATIHINTNASRPDVLRRLIDAGLNSIRISIFSLHDERFRAYYRPVGYGLEQVAQCAELMATAR